MITSERNVSIHYPDSLNPDVVKQMQSAVQALLASRALATTVELVPEGDSRFDENKIVWKVDPKTKQDVAVVTPLSVKAYAVSQGQSSHALSQIMNRLYREAGNPHLQEYFVWDKPVVDELGASHPQVLGLLASRADELMKNHGDYIGILAGVGERGRAAFTEFCETLTVREPALGVN
jgi:hypothetical protein